MFIIIIIIILVQGQTGPTHFIQFTGPAGGLSPA
jgi:hypothetical protein